MRLSRWPSNQTELLVPFTLHDDRFTGAVRVPSLYDFEVHAKFCGLPLMALAERELASDYVVAFAVKWARAAAAGAEPPERSIEVIL